MKIMEIKKVIPSASLIRIKTKTGQEVMTYLGRNIDESCWAISESIKDMVGDSSVQKQITNKLLSILPKKSVDAILEMLEEKNVLQKEITLDYEEVRLINPLANEDAMAPPEIVYYGIDITILKDTLEKALSDNLTCDIAKEIACALTTWLPDESLREIYWMLSAVNLINWASHC